MTVKPACPDHPAAGVLAARKPGDSRRQWVCLACGKLLGDAGPVDADEWESFTLTAGDTDADRRPVRNG